jgi:fructose-1,6-bisphosphatase/inositol monophosphatase family enzyme
MPSDELEFVKELAADAARTALARSSRGVTPTEKSNLSFVTDLDRDLETLIRERLAKRFPDDALSGEEYAQSGGAGPRKWSIDPIDGTGNMVHKLPLWAISIGLIDRGEPVLGVIAIPPLGELYWAEKGKGAFRDGIRLHVVDAAEFHDQDNVSVGTNALRSVDTRTVPGRLRDLGSACCELAFLASNRLHACVFLGEHEHDVAAGGLIATEAGCSIADIDGEAIDLARFVKRTPVTKPTFIAAPRRLEALVRDVRKLPPLPR